MLYRERKDDLKMGELPDSFMEKVVVRWVLKRTTIWHVEIQGERIAGGQLWRPDSECVGDRDLVSLVDLWCQCPQVFPI